MNNAGAALRRLCPILLAALIAGCAGTADMPQTPAPKPEAQAPAPRTETAALPPTPVPVPAPEIKVDAPDAAEIIGWDAAALNETFGAASLIRRDLGAEIWQYRTDACVLFLFLYPGSGGALQVDHLDIRGGDAKSEACLESVVRDHLERRTG
ncbi:MAG: hypothetical protein ACFE0S_12185 [Rhodospirillales bacterium]